MGRIKSLAEIKAEVRAHTGRRKVFRRAKIEDVNPVLAQLTSKDPDLWARAWASAAQPYEAAGIEAEATGNTEQARQDYLQAYTYYCIGRYPVPHSTGKLASFRKSLELYEKAGRYFTPPLERVEIPFQQSKIPVYLRLRKDGRQHPVVINFGGIDGFKAEAFEYEEAMHKAGLDTCAMDMPGVGECPIKGSATAELVFSTVIDYLVKRPEVDVNRIGMVGRSFGGYWSAKMAYVETQRLRAVVVWGGGVHYFCQERWLRQSTNAESYLMDHDIARCQAFGVETIDELARLYPGLSLKTQGWLEKPSAPMLTVNGKEDLQTPIDDLYILLETGAPKSARVFPGGHMGQTPETAPTIMNWLKAELS